LGDPKVFNCGRNQSGRPDLNRGPLAPHASALAKLRHAPFSVPIIVCNGLKVNTGFAGWGEKRCNVNRGGRERTEGWHRPSLPRGYPLSTIGAGGLNDRVREGTGCTPTAIDTNHLPSDDSVAANVHKRSCQNTNFSVSRRISPRPLVPVRLTHYCAYTSGLSNW
jgi:hypothetical protein